MSKKKIEHHSKNKPVSVPVKKPKRPQVLSRKDAQVKELSLSAAAQKVSTLSVVPQSPKRVEWVVKDTTIISPRRISLKKKHSENSNGKSTSKTTAKKSVVRGRALESAKKEAKKMSSPSANSLKQESFVVSDEMKDSEWVQGNKAEKLVSMEEEKSRSASAKPHKEKVHTSEAKSVIRKARTTTAQRKNPKQKTGKSPERFTGTETPVEKKSTVKPEKKLRKGPKGQKAKVLKQSKGGTKHKSSTSSDERVKRKKLKTEQQDVTEIKMITVKGSKGKRNSQASSKKNTSSLVESPTANNVVLEESKPLGGKVSKSTNGKPTQNEKSNIKLKERGKKSQSTVARRVRIRRLKRRRVESLKAGRAAKKQRLNNSPIKDVAKQKISKKRRAKSQLPVQQRKRHKDSTSKVKSKSSPKTPRMSRKKALYKSTISEAQKKNINLVSEGKSTLKAKRIALKHKPVSKTTKRAPRAKLNLELMSKSSLKPQSPHEELSAVSYAVQSESLAVVKQTPVKRTPKKRKKRVARQVYKKITKSECSAQKQQRRAASALKKSNNVEMKSNEKDDKSIESAVESLESSSESSVSSSESSESSQPSSESPMSSESESSEMESSDYVPVGAGSSAGISSKKKKPEKRVQKEKSQRAVAAAVGKAAPNSKVSAKPATKKQMRKPRKKVKRTKKRNPKDTNQMVPVDSNISSATPDAQLNSNHGEDLIVIKVKKAVSGPDEVAYKLLGVTTAAEVKKQVGKKESKTTAKANEKLLPQVKASKKKKTKGRNAGKGLLKPNAKTSKELLKKSGGNVEKVKASKKRKTKRQGTGKKLLKSKARTSKVLPQKSGRKFSKEINDKKVFNAEMKENDSKSDPSGPICQKIKIVKMKTGLYMTENEESSSTSSSESDVYEESSSNESDVSISLESSGKKTIEASDDKVSKASSSTSEFDSISTSRSDTTSTSSSSSTSESTTASASTSSSDSDIILKKFKTVVGKKTPEELYDTSKSVSSLVRKSGASSTVSSTESEDSYDTSSESSSDEDIPILQLKKIIRGRKRKARKPVSRRTKRQRRRIVKVKAGEACRDDKITGEQGGKDGQVKALVITGDADKKAVTQEIEGEVMSSGSNVQTVPTKKAPHKTFDREKKTISAKRKKKKNRRRRVRRRRSRVSQPKEKISITPYQRKNLDFVYSYALKNGYNESNWKDVAKSMRRIKKVKVEEAIEKKLGRRLSSGLNLVRMKFFNLPRVCLKKSDKRRIEREINKKLKTIRKSEGRNYSQQLVSQKVGSKSPSYEKSGSLPLTPTLGQNSETNFMLDLSDDKSLSVNSSINMTDLNEEAQNEVLDKFLTLFGA